MGAIWVGIDVSKRCLDVAIRPAGETLSIDNDDAGIKKLVRALVKWSPQLVVLEATGGHEYAAAYALMKAGLPVAVVNPRQGRDFARAIGKLAKTDPIDARILAHFGEAVQPPARAVPDQQLEEIGHLVTRHRKLIAALVGVAPFNNDSGQSHGRRRIWGGRAHLRSLLYMSVVAGIRFNAP